MMAIHLARKTQIVLLVAKKVKILIKYLDFLDIFLEEKALILSEAIKLNQNAIELQKGQLLFYRPIYNLSSVKLKTLKT